jgi:transposase-like protein
MFKGRQFAQSVILLCVRWYLAYSLSLRDLEEMMAERGIAVDHTTIHRWTVRFAPLLLERFNRRKRSVTGRWLIDETSSRSAASGCIFTAPSTASAIRSNSGSASNVTCCRPSGREIGHEGPLQGGS